MKRLRRLWLWRPRSLIARILLAEAVTLLLAGLLLAKATSALLDSTADRLQKQSLVQQASSVAAAVRIGADGALAIDLPPALRTLYANGYDGRAFAIVDTDGRLLGASRFNLPAIVSQAPRRQKARLFRFGKVIGVSLPIRPAQAADPLGRWVIVTLDETEPGAILDDVAHLFLLRYLPILLLLLLLLPIVNGLAIRRLVQAVSAVSRHAATIEPLAPGARLEEAGLPSEVAPLVHAANGLLDRVQASFQLQAEFSANVAHEIRTPLATLRAQLDAVGDEALRARTIAQVDRMTHVLGQLRDLAALERDTGAFRRVDLSALAVDVIAEAAPRLLALGGDIGFSGRGPVSVWGNPVLIEMALVNLIDNALHHTPRGTRIDVSVDPSGLLVVADDGPGLDAAEWSLATQRFWRADQARSEGAGLGLSIVRRIMEVHDGSLDLLPRDGLGTRIGLRFPRIVAAA